MAKSSKEKELEEKQKAAKEAKKAADDAIKKAELLAEEVAKLESEIKTEKTSEKSGSDSDSDSDSDSSSSSSSSDSESEDGTPEQTVASKKVDSESSGTDSDSDSDGEAKKVQIKKETNDPSSSDDSSDDDSSDDDSSSEEEEEAKAEPAKSKSAGKEVDSSSSSSSDSSDSDSSDAKNGEKKSQNPIKMDVDQKSTDSDSSSSDSDSESDSDSTPASVPPVEESASNKRKADDEASNTPIKKQAVSTGEELNTKLYIRGLPWRATEEAVTAYFQACGSGPKSVELPLQDDGRSSGTAIVDFHDAASAEAALELNGADFEGRWLSIKYSTPKPILAPRQASEKQEGCKTVFVGNLSWDIDEDSLRAAFADCGTISQIRFSTDRETGDFKGYGHIEFFETEATDAAVKLAGTEILGRAVRVDFANDRRQSFGSGGGRGGRGGGGGGRFGSGDRGRGQGRGGFGGRGGGRGGRGGGATTLHKKSGGIANFSGKKITFD